MKHQWLSQYLNQQGIESIEQSIIQIEKKTRGEVIPMVVRSSSTIGHIPMSMFTAGLLMYYLSGAYDYVHEAFDKPWIITAIWTLLLLPLSFYAARLSWVQRLFISSADRESQTYQRALNEFYLSGLHKTEGSTGVLLFISLNDHKAVVLADESIAKKLPPETWNEVVQQLLKGAKEKNLADGFCSAIEKCGDLLEAHFPILPNDVDELLNHLVIKE